MTENWTWRDKLYHWLTGRVPERIYVQRMRELQRDEAMRKARWGES